MRPASIGSGVRRVGATETPRPISPAPDGSQTPPRCAIQSARSPVAVGCAEARPQCRATVTNTSSHWRGHCREMDARRRKFIHSRWGMMTESRLNPNRIFRAAGACLIQRTCRPNASPPSRFRSRSYGNTPSRQRAVRDARRREQAVALHHVGVISCAILDAHFAAFALFLSSTTGTASGRRCSAQRRRQDLRRADADVNVDPVMADRPCE